ncbi:MAG TPA: helix-turn-helix transcriptional regulator [Solimonas sp.]|nr:helix-turn-helix transcriptional regulator [Solimonas sp.]
MSTQRQHLDSPDGDIGNPLTQRELEILELAGKGLSMKAIAQVLGISSGTVGWHLKNSYHKLDAGFRDEALRKARAIGLIDPIVACQVCTCGLARPVFRRPRLESLPRRLVRGDPQPGLR